MRNRTWIIASLLAAPAFADQVPFGDMSPMQQGWSIITGILIFAVLAVGAVAMLLFYTVLRPVQVRREGDAMRKRPVATFISGVLSFTLIFLVVILLSRLPESIYGIPVLLLGLVFGYFLVSGLSSLIHEIGENLLSNVNSRHLGSSFMAVLAGGTLFALLTFVPFLGWVVQFAAMFMALGTSVMPLLKRRAKPAIQPDSQ